MTNTMIVTKVKQAVDLSNAHGIAWLLSNGEELKAVHHLEEKEKLTDERNGFGYWVAAIYESGHRVEA